MKRTAIALGLLAIGYFAGSLMPHAAALDPAEQIVRELRGIRDELANVRRVLEQRR